MNIDAFVIFLVSLNHFDQVVNIVVPRWILLAHFKILNTSRLSTKGGQASLSTRQVQIKWSLGTRLQYARKLAWNPGSSITCNIRYLNLSENFCWGQWLQNILRCCLSCRSTSDWDSTSQRSCLSCASWLSLASAFESRRGWFYREVLGFSRF